MVEGDVAGVHHHLSVASPALRREYPLAVVPRAQVPGDLLHGLRLGYLPVAVVHLADGLHSRLAYDHLIILVAHEHIPVCHYLVMWRQFLSMSLTVTPLLNRPALTRPFTARLGATLMPPFILKTINLRPVAAARVSASLTALFSLAFQTVLPAFQRMTLIPCPNLSKIFISPYVFRRRAVAHQRRETCPPRRPLQEPDGSLVRVRRVVVDARAPLQRQRLLYPDLHIGVVPFRLVVPDEAPLPERADGVDSLELVRLLPPVRQDRELVAPQPALGGELVKDHVLHEVRLHIEPHRRGVPGPLVQVVEPADHLPDRGLPDEAVDEVELGPGLPPEAARLVVVGRGGPERRVGVADQGVVPRQPRQPLPADPLVPEDGAVHYRVVHHLLLPRPVSHEVPVFLSLPPRPLLPPDGVAVAVDGLYLREDHAPRPGDVVQDGVLADEVPDHYEAPAPHVEGAEEGLLDPVGHLADPALVAAELVVVEVVDDDVVGPGLPVPESSRRLPAPAGEELHPGVRPELAVQPRAAVFLLPEVGGEPAVGLQLRLYVAEQADGAVLRLADHDHKVDEPPRLEHQPERQEYVEVG